MAKALLGYVGGIDPRHTRETAQLKQRIAALETEVRRLQEQNAALVAAYEQTTRKETDRLEDNLLPIGGSPLLLEPVTR